MKNRKTPLIAATAAGLVLSFGGCGSNEHKPSQHNSTDISAPPIWEDATTTQMPETTALNPKKDRCAGKIARLAVGPHSKEGYDFAVMGVAGDQCAQLFGGPGTHNPLKEVRQGDTLTSACKFQNTPPDRADSPGHIRTSITDERGVFYVGDLAVTADVLGISEIDSCPPNTPLLGFTTSPELPPSSTPR